MRFPALAAAIAALSLAACGDEPPPPRVGAPDAPSASRASPAPSAPATSPSPSAPAAGGATSAEERKEGANPVQQQVDPKEAEQRRDFQHPRDGEGPTSPETQPKTGS